MLLTHIWYSLPLLLSLDLFPNLTPQRSSSVVGFFLAFDKLKTVRFNAAPFAGKTARKGRKKTKNNGLHFNPLALSSLAFSHTVTYVYACQNVVPSSQPCWCCLQGHAAILHLAFVTFLSHFVFLSLTSHTALLKSNLNSGYCGSHACWNHFATSVMSPSWSSLRVWSVHHRQFLSVYEKSNNMHVCKCLGSHVFK